MKATLRYLLIVMSLVSVLSVSAQTLAQQPEARMQSTSIMAPSGSALPQAAVTGAVTTYEPNSSSNIGSTRRRIGGGQSSGGPDGREDPYADPLGDAAWPLMLLALMYVCVRTFRRRRA